MNGLNGVVFEVPKLFALALCDFKALKKLTIVLGERGHFRQPLGDRGFEEANCCRRKERQSMELLMHNLFRHATKHDPMWRELEVDIVYY